MQSFEFEASITLRKGQNFFDQFPFTEPNTLSAVAQKNKLKLEQVRHVLGRSAFLFQNKKLRDDRFDEKPNQERLLSITASDFLVLKNAAALPARVNSASLVHEIFERFSPFPLTIDYVIAALDKGVYYANGDVHGILSEPTKTYPVMLQEMQKQRERARWFGLEEVLPRGYPASPQIEELSPESWERMRRWRVTHPGYLQ